jgi:hypothetical protein
MLAEIAHRLGRKALEEVAAAAMPDTILGWYRKLIANKLELPLIVTTGRFSGKSGEISVDNNLAAPQGFEPRYADPESETGL